MPASALHPNESERIDALDRLGILDTESEQIYDGLVELAAQITDSPIALLSLVDRNRQWFKSKVGVAVDETLRSQSFCSHAILDSDDPLIVQDASKDPRFADNPLVLEDPSIRFYAGIPLHAPGNRMPIGTLCVIDPKPKSLSDNQLAALQLLTTQAEQLLALRQSEIDNKLTLANLQQQTQFVEMSHDAMFSWTDTHGIQTWNLGAERLYGYTADEALGQTSHTLLQTIHPVPWEEIADAINRNGEWIGEIDHVNKDGRTVTVSTRHQKLELGGEQVVLETNRDITDAKEFRGSLQDAESRLRGMFDNSSNFVGLMSLDGVLLDANRTSLAAAGVAAEDVLGKLFWETPWWSHSPELQGRLKKAAKIASSGQSDSFLATHPTESGEIIEVEFKLSPILSADGAVAYLLPEGRNVTASKAAARELTRIESHLQNLGEIVEQSRNEIFIFRKNDFRFVYANRGAIANLGYSLDELTSMTPLDIKPMFTFDKFLQMVKPLSEGEMENLGFETIHERKNRSRYNAEISLQMTNYGDEDCFVAIVLDTTALSQSIEDLKRANADLEKFASVASHDLRSPLRGVASIATFLREDEGDNLSETSLEYLDTMQDRVRRMDCLLDDLLTYSRLSRKQGELKTVEVADLIDNITKLLSIPDGFEVESATALPTLKTMATPLHQVFLNLISNAIKYHDKQEGRIEIDAHDEGGFVRFSVSDDGPGIDQKHHEQIFEMFQRLHSQDTVDGSGLGLAIVRRLVEQYGGKISLTSEPGNGATFMFTWPKQIEERRVYEH